MDVFRGLLVGLVLLATTGCATQQPVQRWYYNHNHPEHTQQARFNNDQGYCNAIAAGLAPEPPPYIPNVPGTTYSRGTLYGPEGMIGSYQSYSYEKNQVAEMAAVAGMLSSLRQDREQAERRIILAERCMMDLGWLEVGPGFTPPAHAQSVGREKEAAGGEVAFLIAMAEKSLDEEKWAGAVVYAGDAMAALGPSPDLNKHIVDIGKITAVLWHANMMQGEYSEALLSASRGLSYATHYFGPQSRGGAFHLEMMGDAWLAMGAIEDAVDAYVAALETKSPLDERDTERIKAKIKLSNQKE